jgi:hypothetical protein
MMEAASTSETLVNLYQTTRRYIPEDSHLQQLMSLRKKLFDYKETSCHKATVYLTEEAQNETLEKVGNRYI